ELVLGNEDAAFTHLRKAAHLADGAFLAGTLALKRGSFTEAAKYLETAAQQENQLGQLFAKHDIVATLSLPVTEEVSVHVGPDIRGVLLALAETYQGQERRQDAIDCLERLRQLEPHDVLVRLSLVELLMDTATEDREIAQWVVQLAEGVENESPLQTALLLYKAKALRTLGLSEAALEVLSKALNRKKDRSIDLLQALRYEQALVYEGLGQDQRARTELQKLYAEDPDYEDVAAKLGL
ncbi:MAG: tetratricopeptide repeat protein, partial [Candidatus Binatia bacterium]